MKELLYPGFSGEVNLAKIHIIDLDSGHQAKVDVTMVDGRLFSFEFSHTPKDFRGAKRLELNVVMLIDPMVDKDQPPSQNHSK